MAKVPTPSSSVFLDTAYAVALASSTDTYHRRAVALANELESLGTRLVTTWGVLLEIGNALSKTQYRSAARQLLASLQRDASLEIVPLSAPLLQRGLALYAERPDKEWGLTDCISFVVMEEHSIQDALTTDEHFRQAGFRPLLRETTSG
jgi:uncharacterized protein